MMRHLASIGFAVVVLASAALAAPAPAPEPVKAHEFMQRCKADWDFCRVRIQAQMAELNAARDACIPNDVARDRAAARVAYILEEVLEEAPEVVEMGDYKIFIAQIIALIWPCGVVS